MPVFKPRAMDLGFDFKDVSAACLHMAHWACNWLLQTITSTKKRIKKNILFALNFIGFKSKQFFAEMF